MLQNFEILSVAEVAALLRCSKAHVCKAIQGRVRGVTRLPALSMGRRKLIRRQSLEAWLAQNDPAASDGTMERSHKVDAVDA
jgi:excisionase family DNA binding protein